jgi:hypothetical protein
LPPGMAQWRGLTSEGRQSYKKSSKNEHRHVHVHGHKHGCHMDICRHGHGECK